MDQSGPRHQTLKSPIIARPELQSRQQRGLYGALTLVFWAFWIYLWLPVLALLAWALGLQQAYKYMIVLDGYREVLRLAGIYSLIILLLGGALVLWAIYNIIRFRGVENRKAALPVTPVEIGRHFGQSPALVADWQTQQRISVTHDDNGSIAIIRVLGNDSAIPQS